MILEVSDLCKNFGSLAAMNHVSFSVKENEILGIIGPNGAGKTTLLNQISGFIRPSSGRIVYQGKDITGHKAFSSAKLGIARNFQQSLLFMELSVVENVYYAMHIHYRTPIWNRLLRGKRAREEEKNFRAESERIVERMGMGHLKDELAKNLPHGYQRILSVCIGLATKPKLLLLDEPMTGMNQIEIGKMSELVRKIRDDGITIIMIEHNMACVMSLCDRIVVLDHGEKIAEGLPHEIRSNKQVIEAYLGKEE